MDQKARTLRLWEHACCGDRYWSGGRLCDRCGVIAYAVVDRVSVAESMARMHYHARPPAPAPAQAPSIPPAPPPVVVPASRVAGPIQRRPVRHEEDDGPIVRPTSSPPSNPGLTFLLGLGVGSAFLFVVAWLIVIA